MKILVVSDIAKKNHSVRPEVAMFMEWAKSGHTVSIFSSPSEYRRELIAAGIGVFETSQTRKISWSTIRAIRVELINNDYDVIFATNSKSIPSAAFASIRIAVKLVCYRGTVSGLYRTDPTSYLTLLHPRVDGVVCVSASVRDYVKEKIGGQRKNSVVAIYKGHQLAWYNHEPADLTAHNIPADAFVVVAAARFRPSKGLSVLIEAINQLQDCKKLYLLIVGKGADCEPYTSAIQNNKMSERIRVIGYQAEAPRFIAASDVLVQASTRGEGLPRSILEGLAYGVPAISTTSGGAKEILEEGETGFIVDVNDPTAIANRLSALYKEPHKLKAMSANCKKLIDTRLSSASAARQYIEFFQSLAASN